MTSQPHRPDWPSAGPSDLAGGPPSSAGETLRQLRRSLLIRPGDWDALPPEARRQLEGCRGVADLSRLLIEQRLLTPYQAGRVEDGDTSGLILGNYRLLARIGRGSMGAVFKAEHLRLPRLAAVKVLQPDLGQHPTTLRRFYAEMRAVSRLYHPNIVSIIDAGEVPAPDPDTPARHYYVMDYVPGQDLERHVCSRGPLPVATACNLIHQTAAALGEAHKHDLVHRDVKPSNVLVTPEEQIKLLDFGLARHFCTQLTEPGIVLGTLEYMSPEQAGDSTEVDARTDIYGLGGTLFWCLTGRHPFVLPKNPVRALAARRTGKAPSARACRPEVPKGLDAVLARMMATDPADRFPDAGAVMSALLPFLHPGPRGGPAPPPVVGPSVGEPLPAASEGPSARRPRVLIADDERDVRHLCRLALRPEAVDCELADDGVAALAALQARPFDLVLLGVEMPRLGGVEVLRRVRGSPSQPNTKVIMLSGRASADELAGLLSAGADDYLTKPLSLAQLRYRMRAALQLKWAQDHSERLDRELLSIKSGHGVEGRP
jgi:putative two-component system response regulator